MNAIPETLAIIAEKIGEVNEKIQHLEQEIAEIGYPAAVDLKRRFDALKVEEGALRRNFIESLNAENPDIRKIEKVAQLLRHVEQEEAEVEHDADFLQQAAPSSMTLVVEAGAHIVDLYRRGIKKIIGDHHLLGESVFVNHTNENLTHQYGLGNDSSNGSPPPPGK